MSTKIHKLKIQPPYFQLLIDKIKTFEVRKNDRDYNIGDFLELYEWDGTQYTGRCAHAKISYILSNTEYCKEGFIIMSIILVD